MGFDPAVLETEGLGAGSFGLFSVRERLALVGGQLEVHAAPGRGARMTILAPCNEAPQMEHSALLVGNGQEFGKSEYASYCPSYVCY